MPPSPAAPAPAFPNGYTRADNWLFDYVLPRARPNTFKVVAAVVRQTAGWHREEARLPLSALHPLTGIASRQTLVDAVADALAQGFIQRDPAAGSYAYRPCILPLDSEARSPGRRPSAPPPGSGASAKRTGSRPEAPAPAVQKVDRDRSAHRTGSGTISVPPSFIEKKGKERGKKFSRLPAEKAPPSPPPFPEKRAKLPNGEPSAPRPSGPEERGGEPPGAGPAASLPDTPGAVYRALRALEPGIRKGETLAVARHLLAGDPQAGQPAYSAADVVACARFLQTDPWRVAKMVPLSARHVAERIGRWVAAGRPATWQAWEAQSGGRHPAGAPREREPAGFAAIRAFLAEREAPAAGAAPWLPDPRALPAGRGESDA